MLQTFLKTLEQMLAVLCLLGVGYGLNRGKLIPKGAEVVISKLLTLFFLPCLTLYSFLAECTPENLVAYLPWVLCGGGIVLLSMGMAVSLSRLLGKGRGEYLQGVYTYALCFPNTGAIGTPLILAFFGTAGLFQYNLFLIVNGIINYSWGIAQMLPSHTKKGFLARLHGILNPNFAAMLLGVVLGLLRAKDWMPQIVPETLQKIGGCYSVMGLLMTGYVIADYRPAEILSDRNIYIITALRLLLLPGLYLLLLRLFHAPYMLCVVVCLVYACPCGMNTIVYPAAFGKDSRTGASLVLVSSMLSILTIPIMYTLTGLLCG